MILVLSVIVGILVIILILLPGIAKNYIVKHSKEYIHRDIAIDHLQFNYLTSTIRIYGFKLYEEDGKEVFVSFDKMLVNLQPINLLRNELVVEKFELDGLYANIIQRDSIFNFDDIIDFLNKPADSAASAKDTTPSKPMHYRLYDLSLKNATLVYDDRNVKNATRLENLSFTVPYIAFGEGESDAGLSFTTARGGYFESALKIDPDKGNYNARVVIRNLHLDNFDEYISYYTGIQSLNGVFNCQVQLIGNIFNPEATVVSGDSQFQELVMTDKEGKKFVGVDQLDIGLKNIDYAHSSYAFDTIRLTGPYLHFVLSDSTNNVEEIFSMPEDTNAVTSAVPADTASSPSSISLFYSVDKFIITKGIVDYTDNLTGEPFNYHLSDIELETDSITTDAGWVDLYSRMRLNERGTLEAKVGFNPADPVKNIRLDYVIKDFQLSDLNIYSSFYTGVPVVTGNMYYKSSTIIDKGILNSENKLVMTDVKLGSKGGGIYDIPIRLALFILRDKYGVINLDVPVKGDLNDPKVKLGRIIWNTFKNLIVKVATKPFDILAQSIGADPKEIESIEFDYLDTTITAQKQRQLELLLKLEEQKPGLQIDMTYYNDINKEEELISGGAINYADDPEIRARAERMAALRKSLLEEHLHAVNDSTSIRITAADAQDPKNIGSRPVFMITYTLNETEQDEQQPQD